MRLTYLELLEAVKEGKQPKKVKVGSIVYSWDGCEYVQNTDTRQSLSDRLPNWTAKAQTTADFIEEVTDILTGEEKEHLRTVLKPVRDKTATIEKMLFGGMTFVRVRYKIDLSENVYLFDFPVASLLDDAYGGMECGQRYTLEELDL